MNRSESSPGGTIGAELQEEAEPNNGTLTDTAPEEEVPPAVPRELDGPRASRLARDGPASGGEPQAQTFISPFGSPAVAAVDEPEDGSDDSILPRAPRAMPDLGLSKAFLADLAVKILHYSGTPTSAQLTRRLGLSAP